MFEPETSLISGTISLLIDVRKRHPRIEVMERGLSL